MSFIRAEVAFIALLLGTNFATPAWAEPRLADEDRFVAFGPGFGSYAVDRGHELSTATFLDFGVTHTNVSSGLDTASAGRHYEIPDIKYRVRLTLTGPSNPNGDIVVSGVTYEWDGDSVTPGEIITGSPSETISVVTNGTYTTSTYWGTAPGATSSAPTTRTPVPTTSAFTSTAPASRK
jgi:hypothetical protein